MITTTNRRRFVCKWRGAFPALALAFALFTGLPSTLLAGPTVNVSFSGTQAISLMNEFIARTTEQYVGTVSKSTYFADTYSIAVSGKNEGVPPVQPPVVLVSTGTYIVKIGEDTQTVYQSTASVKELIVYGFVDGMEQERASTLRLIEWANGDVYISGTCGGLISGTTVAADAFLSGCSTAYAIMESTITQRNGEIPVVFP